MEFYEREFFIYRLMSGYVKLDIGNTVIKVVNPDADVKMEAQLEYAKEYGRAIEDGILTDAEVEQMLIEEKYWSEEMQKQMDKIIPDHIEYWKIQLFNNYLKSNTCKTIRGYLAAAKKELARLYALRHSYDFTTCEGLASLAKSKCLMRLSSYYTDGKPVDWLSHNIEKVIDEYHRLLLNAEQLRELARTSPWNNIWHTYRKAGNKLFKNESLTDEQIVLISWSTNYDSIYESPECPPDSVIEDDDMLDGWLAIQKKKREKSRNESAITGAISGNDRINNSGEIYVVAETTEDIEKIESLNNPLAMSIKKARAAQLQREGYVPEAGFQDVQRELSMKFTRMQQERLKGR